MRLRGRMASTDAAMRFLPVFQGRTQLHVLANALSTVGALIRRRPEIAEDLLGEFAGYLRQFIGTTRPLVPLAEELRLTLTFVAVHRARLGGRLRMEVAVSPEAMGALVPPCILQPLVENAILHGIAGRPTGGRVRITGRIGRGMLHIAVADDGLGPRRPFAGGIRTGWGLTSVRLRVAALWNTQARVRLLGRPGLGTLVSVSMPAVIAQGRRT